MLRFTTIISLASILTHNVLAINIFRSPPADQFSVPWGEETIQPFRMLDDLNPEAPMDRVDTVGGKSLFFPEFLGGNSVYQQAQTIPQYRNPDAFPSDLAEKSEDSQKLGEKPATHHWYRRVPVEITQDEAKGVKPLGGHTITKYKIMPSDTTFPNGQVFSPKNHPEDDMPAGGNKLEAAPKILAPMERIPEKYLPIQAPMDDWSPNYSGVPVPVAARNDLIPVKYAKYMDEVADAELSCSSNSKQEHCVVKGCENSSAGKKMFTLILGNSMVENTVEIIKRLPGERGGFRVKYNDPKAADFNPDPLNKGKYDPVDCSLLGCTLYRPCYHEAGAGPYTKAGCAAMSAKDELDAFKDLSTKVKCPKYHKPCSTIMQDVNLGSLYKDGKMCV